MPAQSEIRHREPNARCLSVACFPEIVCLPPRLQGSTLKEGCNINLSLSALGTVIDTLVKGMRQHPVRNCRPLCGMRFFVGMCIVHVAYAPFLLLRKIAASMLSMKIRIWYLRKWQVKLGTT